MSERERGQLAERCEALTVATQQTSELSLQLAAMQKELQGTKKRQGFLAFHDRCISEYQNYFCDLHLTGTQTVFV
jgi:hypothetical protein